MNEWMNERARSAVCNFECRTDFPLPWYSGGGPGWGLARVARWLPNRFFISRPRGTGILPVQMARSVMNTWIAKFLFRTTPLTRAGSARHGDAISEVVAARKRARMRQVLRLIVAAPIALLCLAALAFRGAVSWWAYPAGFSSPPPASTWIEDQGGGPLAAFASTRGDWRLPLAEHQISPHLLDAIVAVEDSRFYDHAGVDWRSVGGALWEDISSRRARRGASTIAMQLQRLREPVPRSLWQKIEQAVRAMQIERMQSKRAILVEYLNDAPFGGNLVGAGAASWRYFGKPCQALSLGQAALLAGLPQSPNRLRPDRHPQAARARRDHVLDRMVACRMITLAQRAEAGNEPVDAAWQPLPQDAIAADGLLPALTRLAETQPGQTLRVHIDRDVQRQCASAMRDSLATLEPSHVNAAAVVILDTPSGNCLASVSLVTAGDAQTNAIDLTQCPRSSGSTLKPFIYAAAFDLGICKPATILQDAPGEWSGYEPVNYDHVFRGAIPAGEALAQSRNLPAIELLSRVGVGRAVELLRAAGFANLSRTPDRYGLPLAIGGAEVTPMELAEAYASLARGGQHRAAALLCDHGSSEPVSKLTKLIHGFACSSPSAGTKGEGRGGDFEHQQCAVLEEAFSPTLRRSAGRGSDSATHLKAMLPGPALSPTACLATLGCLADPDRTARVCPEAALMGIAWKTGTSSGHRDAWCAAVTPRRTVVVWLGNLDSSGADRLVGQEAAAPLALKIIAACDRVRGAGFEPCIPPGSVAGAAPIAVQPRMTLIQLISPADGQQIIRDGSIPADAQRCPLARGRASRRVRRRSGGLSMDVSSDRPRPIRRCGGRPRRAGTKCGWSMPAVTPPRRPWVCSDANADAPAAVERLEISKL